MIRTEMNDETRQDQELIREDIVDKAKYFCSIQKEVIILTKPSARYPNGARFQGFIFDATYNKIELNDTFVNKRITIYISEITSPSDIFEKEEKNGDKTS